MSIISPQLALAAAAAIRDKALEDQSKELIELKKQLRASKEVEITGKMGKPVYCRGSFQDGNFREILPPGGALWEVRLTPNEAFEGAGIPLGSFWPDMEIRLGGVVFASTLAVVGTNCRVRGAGSNTSRVDVFCPISSGDKFNEYHRVAWMSINFRFLPEGPWKHLQSCRTFNSGVAQDERDDIFHKISHPTQFPRRIPNQTADIPSICFHSPCVLGLIKNVHRDAEFEREKGVKLAEIETIMDSLRG